MKRWQAINVLREIIRICADNGMVIRSVSLIPPQNIGITGYQLSIGAALNYACREGLMPLIKENGLVMEENKDHILIFGCQ